MNMTYTCGWCITHDHDKCRVSMTYEDRTWYCKCGCRDASD